MLASRLRQVQQSRLCRQRAQHAPAAAGIPLVGFPTASQLGAEPSSSGFSSFPDQGLVFLLWFFRAGDDGAWPSSQQSARSTPPPCTSRSRTRNEIRQFTARAGICNHAKCDVVKWLRTAACWSASIEKPPGIPAPIPGGLPAAAGKKDGLDSQGRMKSRRLCFRTWRAGRHLKMPVQRHLQTR